MGSTVYYVCVVLALTALSECVRPPRHSGQPQRLPSTGARGPGVHQGQRPAIPSGPTGGPPQGRRPQHHQIQGPHISPGPMAGPAQSHIPHHPPIQRPQFPLGPMPGSVQVQMPHVPHGVMGSPYPGSGYQPYVPHTYPAQVALPQHPSGAQLQVPPLAQPGGNICPVMCLPGQTPGDQCGTHPNCRCALNLGYGSMKHHPCIFIPVG